jgi:hypothetical protein
MKIGDLLQYAKESIKKVRTARANSAVRELDVEALKPFTTATKIEDIIARVDTLVGKLEVNSNEGLRLMYQMGSDVQMYRTVRALQSGLAGMISWEKVDAENAFSWFVPVKLLNIMFVLCRPRAKLKKSVEIYLLLKEFPLLLDSSMAWSTVYKNLNNIRSYIVSFFVMCVT